MQMIVFGTKYLVFLATIASVVTVFLHLVAIDRVAKNSSNILLPFFSFITAHVKLKSKHVLERYVKILKFLLVRTYFHIYTYNYIHNIHHIIRLN